MLQQQHNKELRTEISRMGRRERMEEEGRGKRKGGRQEQNVEGKPEGEGRRGTRREFWSTGLCICYKKP